MIILLYNCFFHFLLVFIYQATNSLTRKKFLANFSIQWPFASILNTQRGKKYWPFVQRKCLTRELRYGNSQQPFGHLKPHKPAINFNVIIRYTNFENVHSQKWIKRHTLHPSPLSIACLTFLIIFSASWSKPCTWIESSLWSLSPSGQWFLWEPLS